MDIQDIMAFLSLMVGIFGAILTYIQVVKRYKGEKMGDYYVGGAILRCHQKLLEKKHVDFGKALSKEFPASTQPNKTKGFTQRFEGNASLLPYPHEYGGENIQAVSIYRSKKYGAYGVFGSIGQKYEKAGGTFSDFGFPKSNEKTKNGVVFQRFEGGLIDDQ